MEKNEMKHKVSALAALVLLSISFTSGCKTNNEVQPNIQIIDSTNVVTNTVPVKTFNDEHYVWENFYFSTNKVQNAK